MKDLDEQLQEFQNEINSIEVTNKNESIHHRHHHSDGSGHKKGHRRHHHRHSRKKWPFVVLGIFLGIVIFLCSGYLYLKISGQYHLKKRTSNQIITLDSTSMPDSEVIEEGVISYNGEKYKYNEDIMTFLFLGIDSTGKIKTANEGEGGQSDTMLLLVLNSRTKKLSLIGINRNTMTEISIFDKSGNFLHNQVEQIALAYSFGDGREKSADNACKAVTNLFYNLPINGYCSINIDAIPFINDEVGGVPVLLAENFSYKGNTYKAGQTVTLKGKMATDYLRERMNIGDGSNEYRMERQKAYLKAFIEKLKMEVSGNISVVGDLYQTIRSYMVSNISLSEMVYLSSVASQYSFDDESIQYLTGTTGNGGLYDEFYADDKALYELILKVFYEKI